MGESCNTTAIRLPHRRYSPTRFFQLHLSMDTRESNFRDTRARTKAGHNMEIRGAKIHMRFGAGIRHWSGVLELTGRWCCLLVDISKKMCSRSHLLLSGNHTSNQGHDNGSFLIPP